MNYSEEDLWRDLAEAFLKVRLGKRNTRDEHNFEVNLFENLMILKEDIVNRTYSPGRGIAFIIHDPVTREIFAAPFRDRVVHHFIFNHVYEWWDKRFIYDSYSCRKDKGTLFGIRRLAHHIAQESENYTKETYIIKLDLQGYFMSLNRKMLFKRAIWGLDRQFPEKGDLYHILRFLWKQVIFDDPVKTVTMKGKESDWRDLPASKSLFCQPEGQGIVIGNLTSQLLSNIYLDQLDRFVKFHLGYDHYGRYVDDFFIVVKKEKLEQAKRDIAVIENFLSSIGLTLHPKKRRIQEMRKGVDFIGAVVYPHHIVPSKRLMKNFKKAVRGYPNNPNGDAMILSYLGQMKHLNSDKMIKKVFDEVGWRYEI